MTMRFIAVLPADWFQRYSQTHFNGAYNGVPVPNLVKLIKAVRAFTGLGLVEAKRLVDNRDATIYRLDLGTDRTQFDILKLAGYEIIQVDDVKEVSITEKEIVDVITGALRRGAYEDADLLLDTLIRMKNR